jgi:SAM-dependent methyltransferase
MSTMETADPKASEQHGLWNGIGGRTWVDLQELLDQLLSPFEELLVAAVPAGSNARLLDVGCGTGQTTIAFARRLGEASQCVGVDISEPMITLARARAEKERTPPKFILADAQTHAFEPRSFDIVSSRFGVMFFDDPIQAFVNLRRAGAGAAELRFVAWRSPDENPFMTAAERAAAPFLPELPPRRPDEPGQFAFADRDRVQRILSAAGWSHIDIAPIDVTCTMPETDLMPYVTRMGPVGRVLQQAGDEIRKGITEKLRAAFDPYVHGTEVRASCACWLVSAQSSPSAVR